MSRPQDPGSTGPRSTGPAGTGNGNEPGLAARVRERWGVHGRGQHERDRAEARSVDLPDGVRQRAGARRAPRGDSQEHRRAGQAHRRAEDGHRARRHQAAPRGSVPSLQAQTPHQGNDCARSGPRWARRGAAGRSRLDPETEAAKYLKPAFTTENGDNPGVPDVKAALEGARQILMEQFAEDAELLGELREHLQDQRPARIQGRGRQGRGRREIPRLLRLPRAHQRHSLASGTGAVPRPQGRDPAAGAEAAGGARGAGGGYARRPRATPFNRCERKIAARFQHRRPGASGGCLAAADGALDLAGQAGWQLEGELFAALRERAEEEAIRVFAQKPARSAARGSRGSARHHGPRSGLADRCQGRRRRSHRQGPRNRDDLSACAAQRLGWLTARPGRHREEAQRRPHQHRQRHRLPRNRQARRRTDQAASRAEADEDRGVRGGRVGVFRLRARLARVARDWMSACAAPSPLRGACRIRWPSW